MMESFAIVFNTVAAIASVIAVIAFAQIWRAEVKRATQIKAILKLQEVSNLLQQNKYFEAFDAIGMGNHCDDLTLEEARQVFMVRVSDLAKVARGGIK